MRTQPTGGAGRKVALAIALLALSATGAAQSVAVAADTTLRLVVPVTHAADALAAQGYLLAAVDSTRADTAFVTLGARAVVQRFEVVGAASVPLDWATAPGAPASLPTSTRPPRATRGLAMRTPAWCRRWRWSATGTAWT